ncbi:MAG: hypothetical protein K8U57_35965 [Planctomycetes bacterium]|nr:hypothetical protein [Planctomycetota bacterium]
MTDTSTAPEPRDLTVENALLRGSLYLSTRALKDYHDSKHTPTDDGRLQLTVPESLREKAGDAIARANNLLRDDGPGKPR